VRGFPRLTALFRAGPAVSPTELQSYADAVGPLLERLGGLYVRWRQSLELDAQEEVLANAGSIQRWEAAGLRDRLRGVEPPAGLARAHAELILVAANTARASQLFSNGYRFHSSSARCDGHALLLASEERFAALRADLERRGISVRSAGGSAGPT
jgi:hypothetical protein